jgi:broad specificity phosphatase PhoE
MSERVVYLVRHGEVHNPSRVRYGRLPGYSLSERGRAEALARASWLRSRIRGPLAIVSSPLERAAQTAEVLREALGADGLVVLRDERLIEARSRFDGLRYRADALGHFVRVLTLRGDLGDEAPSMVASRVLAAVFAWARDAERGALVMVSHQLPIQYARMQIERDGARWWPWTERPRCETGSVTVLSVEGDRARVVEYEG